MKTKNSKVFCISSLIATLFLFTSLLHSQIPSGPKINFSEEEWKIETPESVGVLTHTFIIKNGGDEELVINRVISSCKCVVPSFSSANIPANSETELKLTFNISESKRPHKHFIYVNSNDPIRPNVMLTILRLPEPLITPTLDIDPIRWDFGLASLGESPNKKIAISNVGKEPLAISKISSSSNCKAKLLTAKRLVAGEKGYILVKLKPLKTEGMFKASVYVNSNDATNPHQKIVITGFVIKNKVPGKVVHLYFFYTQDCKECIDLKDKYILKLKGLYGDKLEVRYLDISEFKNYELLVGLEDKYSYVGSRLPIVVIGEYILGGADEIKSELERIIDEYMLKEGCDWPVEIKRVPADNFIRKKVGERFNSIGTMAVISAGILDGVNPCAFATIIFFVSYLTFAGRERRQILAAGTSFIIAVFITYFLIGLGLFQGIRSLSGFPVLGRAFYFLAACLALYLGGLNFYDYYKFKQGKINEMKLQLPQIIKSEIHKTIRTGARLRNYIFVAFGIGVVVSFLELSCTGQLYLPTISYVVGIPALRTRALYLLFVYNSMFIFPLILIFILCGYGISSERLGKVIRRHLGGMKIVTGIFFIGLSSLLFLIFYCH